MKKIPHIIKILEVGRFKVKALWDTGEIRVNNFTSELKGWENEPLYKLLTEIETFKEVSVSENGTLEWENVGVSFMFKGKKRTEPLDLDPVVLYNSSTLVEEYKPPHIGEMLKTAREKAGLTQEQVAKRTGTTRSYISKVENGNADIRVGTLQRILALGMGGSLAIASPPSGIPIGLLKDADWK